MLGLPYSQRKKCKGMGAPSRAKQEEEDVDLPEPPTPIEEDDSDHTSITTELLEHLVDSFDNQRMSEFKIRDSRTHCFNQMPRSQMPNAKTLFQNMRPV